MSSEGQTGDAFSPLPCSDSAALAPEGRVGAGGPPPEPPPPPLPTPHPEPLLFVRLDLRIQLPQCVREATEEQVLPDQLVCALHRLRHRCARALQKTRAAQGGGAGLGATGRSLSRAPRTSRHAQPTNLALRPAPQAPPEAQGQEKLKRILLSGETAHSYHQFHTMTCHAAQFTPAMVMNCTLNFHSVLYRFCFNRCVC